MLATIALSLTAGSVVLADHDASIVLDEENKRITICHATSSETNPYNQITPAVNSAGFVKAGHADHEDDIIPPYYYEPADFHFPGLNWTAEGMAIYENDCEIAAPPTDAPPTDAPPTDAPPTDAPPTAGSPAAAPPTPPDTAADPAGPMSPASSLPLLAVLMVGGLAGILALYGALARRPQER